MSEKSVDANKTVKKALEDAKSIFGKIIPLFKSPVKETKKMMAEGNMILGFEMIAVNVVVMIVMILLAMLKIKSGLGMFGDYIKIPYFEIVVAVIIMQAISYIAVAGFLLLGTKVAFKIEATFEQMIALTGAKAIMDICLFVVGIICTMLSAKLGMFILVVAEIYTLIVMLVSFVESIGLDSDKKCYSLLITFVGQFLSYYIVYSILAESVFSKFSSLMSF